ncbi:hypothetical protein PRK78_002872 [Emydomyces testavorans]|uniref:Uncharacterized protein n=1 Tax=Emydomyces testavorans TaxID=2070801 RepID=A0AAF0DF37_9EURO|nr:hypothetical protein PRK78_002872 [Emydomyces testavorans]
MASAQYSVLHKELAAIITKYMAIDSMRPDVAEIAKSPEYLDLFRDVLENHVSMIKKRPQNFEDGKITLYDKALLILTSNGKNLHNLGAIELFLDEILGVRNVGNIERILEKNLALRSMFGHITHRNEAHSFKENVKGQNVEKTTRKTAENTAAEWPAHNREPSNATRDSKSPVSKMLDTLARARAEFYSVDESKRGSKYLAAKFLRDTAENTLTYFRETGLENHEMMPRIMEAYQLGHEKTVEATGGRLRPFEMGSRDYHYRTRQLRNTRLNYGRSDCYRPGERRALPVRSQYSRFV